MRIVPRPSRLGAALPLVLALLAAPVLSGADFPPAKTENLKVLPETMPINDVLDTMKAFAKSLGVRCWFCHVGEEGMDLSEFDFISDEKAEKKAARVMIRMTREINLKFLSEAGAILDEDVAPRIGCVTCHRGHAEPQD